MVNNIGLTYFASVARIGSIRKAAEHLHVAASAISRQIRLLEDELGTQLFERGKNTLRLTPEGALVLDYARSVDHGLEQLLADIQAIDKLQRGNVRIGISESFTREFLPGFLHAFHTDYPGIQFQVTVAGGAALMAQLVSDQLDATLSYIPPEAIDVAVVEQVMVQPCLLAPASHPLAAGKVVRLEQLAGQNIALPDDSLSIYGSYIRMFAGAGIKPAKLLQSNSFEFMRSAVASGLCLAISNDYFGAPSSAAAVGLRYLPLQGDGVEAWPLKLCVHAERSLPVAARLLIDRLQQALRQAAP